MAEKKKKLVSKLKSKYLLVIRRETTFEEVWQMKLSRMNVITTIAISLTIYTVLVVTLVVFTPLKQLIPGYPGAEMTRNIRMNAIRLDSLEYQLDLKDQFIENMITVINGGEPVYHSSEEPAPAISVRDIQDNRALSDSLLRLEVEQAQRFNVDATGLSVPELRNLNQLYFFPPVRGLIMAHFDYARRHFGVDLATAANQPIKATLDGTVIMADYTTETGYTLQIQHDHNLLSVYKHNKQILKKTGDRVRAGEVIAIVGNTGELTTGPHLHFELWHMGTPLNPEHFMAFE
ncbi:MAG: M23 family metallopeptidase [Bacteroidales bacterium]|jgi:murein DD-endopeptidase MepM/ murein hydrolase activator NlpD|nr:M23 family metallopeptidase [Bacteroidales bacterium]